MMIPMCCSKVVSKFMSKSKESCASVFPTSWHCCSVTDSKRKSETNHLQQQGELIPDSINITVTNSTYVKIGNEKNGSISGLPQSYRIPLKKSKSQNRLQSFPFFRSSPSSRRRSWAVFQDLRHRPLLPSQRIASSPATTSAYMGGSCPTRTLPTVMGSPLLM